MVARKLTFDQAEAIRRQYSRTMEICEQAVTGAYLVTPEDRAQGAVTMNDIARELGVTYTVVRNAILGATYRSEEFRNGYNEPMKYLSYLERETIRAAFRAGMSVKKVKKLFPKVPTGSLYYYSKQVRTGTEPKGDKPNTPSEELARLDAIRKAGGNDTRYVVSVRPVDWIDRDSAEAQGSGSGAIDGGRASRALSAPLRSYAP